MAFCLAQRKFSEFSNTIDDVAIARRIPCMGAFELTFRCNQACRHCYCNLGPNDRHKADELTTAEVKRVLDEISDAGCLWLLFTGGEVLLREDFADIYLHALRRGMIVEVFTNGTLIDDRMAGLFAEFSPIGIDISIYGATAAVHDNITRSSGSFEKTMTGIEALRRHKVRFSLKTIIMTLNRADLGNMKALAASLGVKFHFDSIISPRTDGGMLPARYRLSADEMVQLELDEDYESCKRAFDGYWNKKPTGAFTCGAGVFAFNISPYGVLSPCNMFRSFQYPLREAPFGGLWKRMVAERDEKQGGFFPEECRSCSMFLLCSNCPAWEELETGSWQKKVEYTCEYAKCFEREFFKKKEMISAIKE